MGLLILTLIMAGFGGGKVGKENWFSDIFYPEKLYDFELIDLK